MSSVVHRDFDDILKDIAEALFTNDDIDNLGKALGFGNAEIGRKIEENSKQGGNYMGTLALLRKWQNSQTTSTERAALKEALIKAGLKKQADQFLSTPVTGLLSGQQQETATGPSPATMAAATSTSGSNKREVTNEEIVKLSKLLPDGKYTELCGNLGYEYSYIQGIKKKNFMDPVAAFVEILHEFKKKPGSVEELDAALIKADLGGLVPKYKN